MKKFLCFCFAAAFCLTLSGCGKGAVNQGAEYAKTLGWYDPVIAALDITTKEQVDALQPGAVFPEISAEGEGVTFSLVQTLRDGEWFYALTRVNVDPSVPMEPGLNGVGTPTPLLACVSEANASLEYIYPCYLEYTDAPGWEIYMLLRFPADAVPAGEEITLECVRLEPLVYTGEDMPSSGMDDLPYTPLPDLNLQLTWAPA